MELLHVARTTFGACLSRLVDTRDRSHAEVSGEKELYVMHVSQGRIEFHRCVICFLRGIIDVLEDEVTTRIST